MPKVSWLDRVRQKLELQKRRATKSRTQRTESLEERAYLSVSTLVVGGNLQIVANSDEAIAVGVNSSNGNVLVLVNGLPTSGLPAIQASQLRGLNIRAGQGDNLIDLSGVTSANFSFQDPNTGEPLQINVDAGNGRDTVIGTASFEDSIDGGDGDDVINNATGTFNVAQVLIGGDGNDTITGGIGNDTIFGGDGNDVIDGQIGTDSIEGGDGSDTLNGGVDNDFINGNYGPDSITGGDGDDTILGDSGLDSLFGEDGDDSIFGGGGNDLIFGDQGTSATGTGNDTVFGNSGDDTIRGNGGADLLMGQTGDDRISVVEASFSIADATVDETDAGTTTTISFIVRLAFELPVTTSVDASVESITATLGTDVEGGTKKLVFAPGVTSQIVTFTIFGDDTSEQDETFRVRLSNAIGVTIADDQAIGTIVDNDAPPPSQFNIDLTFSGGLTPSQQASFTLAAQRIQQMITGDVPDITVPGLGLVDDVVIDASGVFIDGVNGILGQAGPTGLRGGTFLPFAGIMQFDTADLASLEATGQLVDTITHEMMHVLGFGTIWSNLGLLVNAGTTNPQYIGPNALAEYNTRFGQTGTSVPIEGNAGPGSNDAHWRESIFLNELMSPFLDSGINPVSRVTVAQFQDLGYQVNLGAAEPYLTSGTNVVGPRTSRIKSHFNRPELAPVIGVPTSAPNAAWGDFFAPYKLPSAPANSVSAVAGNSAAVVSGKPNLEALPSLIQTITFDEVPTQPTDDLTVADVTFDFKINGVDSTDATYGVPAPAVFANLSGGTMEGNAGGVLTLDFSTPVSAVSFNVARSIGTAIAAGVRVTAFDANLNLVSTTDVPMSVLVAFVEGQYSYGGSPIRRLVLDFTSASTATGGARFALDNLVYDTFAISTTGSATIMGGDGNDTLTGGFENDLLVGDLGDDILAAGGGDDMVYGGAGLDTAYGGEGDDSVYGQGANDTVFGGAGDDSVDGGLGNNLVYGDDLGGIETGNDTLVGGNGNDTVFAGRGDDVLYGGSGADLLNGEDGNDTLFGQGGVDTLNGGAGDDQLNWRGAADGSDILDASDGQDAVVINGNATGQIFTIGQSSNRLTITEGGSTLTIVGPDEEVGSPVEQIVLNTLGGSDRVNIGSINTIGTTLLIVNTGTDNDVINATGALIGNVRLQLNGDAGDDTITGSEGGDEVFGGTGNDLLNGRGGEDTIRGGDGDDIANGDAGADSILGEGGADQLNGGDGDDQIDGGAGSDSIQAGAGNDTALGGAGSDLLIGDFGNDRLEGQNDLDTLLGNAGDDTLDGGRNDDVMNGGGGDDKLRGDHGNDLIQGREGNDTIDGGDGQDTIDGGDGDDAIQAGDGDDNVVGGVGNDTIVGGDGNDTLIGGAGADILLGEDGDDAINGNGGSDTISGGEGSNVIVNDPADVRNESFVLSFDQLLRLSAAD